MSHAEMYTYMLAQADAIRADYAKSNTTMAINTYAIHWVADNAAQFRAAWIIAHS